MRPCVVNVLNFFPETFYPSLTILLSISKYIFNTLTHSFVPTERIKLQVFVRIISIVFLTKSLLSRVNAQVNDQVIVITVY